MEITKDQLQEANGARIEAELDDFKDEIWKGVLSDLKKSFKDFR